MSSPRFLPVVFSIAQTLKSEFEKKVAIDMLKLKKLSEMYSELKLGSH